MNLPDVRIIYHYQPDTGQDAPVGAVRFTETETYHSEAHPYPTIAADILAAAVAQRLQNDGPNPWGPDYRPIDENPEGHHEFRPDQETIERITLGWSLTAHAPDDIAAGLACLKVWRMNDDQLVENLERMEAQPD